jgi:hypothetical protein
LKIAKKALQKAEVQNTGGSRGRHALALPALPHDRLQEELLVRPVQGVAHHRNAASEREAPPREALTRLQRSTI